MRDCQPSCLGSCLAFNSASTCETTCASACAITCPSRIKSKLLRTSLVEYCLNDCLADCLLSSDFKKMALLDGKAKQQCQELCQSSCENTVIPAIENLPPDAVLFATETTNLKKATFSKYGCTQKCSADCNEKCFASGAPSEVCGPSCEAFCSEKCDFTGPKLPEAMCVSACRPDCDRTCILDKTLDLIFGFVEKTKNLTLPNLEQLINKDRTDFQYGQFHQYPAVAQVIPVPTETKLLPPVLPQAPQVVPPVQQVPQPLPVDNQNQQNHQTTQPLPQPDQTNQVHSQIDQAAQVLSEIDQAVQAGQAQQAVPLPPDPAIKLPQVPATANCQSICLPSCLIQCQSLNRPNLNCTRVCDRTCDLNCSPSFPTTFGSYPTSQSEIQTKCREQLSLKCGALCQSAECAEICGNAVRFLCTRSAECNGICQKSCSQHCLLKDKAFAQCGPSCAESCQRECRLSDEIRKECQSNCVGTCGRKCEATSPTIPLKLQCNTNCPQLCHSVCFE